MLSAAILVPLLGALVLGAWPRTPWPTSVPAMRAAATAVAAVPLVLLILVWLRYPGTSAAAPFALVEAVPWIPTLGVAWRLGVDGISLPLAALSALLFVAAVAYPLKLPGRAHHYYAWLMFLEGVSLGVFLVIDLLLFYVFFDLSLVGMYFLIGRFGHGDARRAALKFFLYTLAGSLLLLLAILALHLGMPEASFDMRDLTAAQPLAGTGTYALVVLAGLLIGLGIKTPVVPFHTWLPPAHVDAPGPVSAILAGVLLKMGTYGMIRIPLSMMRESFRDATLMLAVIATASILYGALVALGQGNLKRRIAYTSVNHMGYTVLGIAAAGSALGSERARALALTGATVEMVAHGLITGALFLIAGSFWQRGGEYRLDAYGGLAARAPRLTVATSLAAFASLGLPGLAGFVAEFQVFVGAFAVYPWLAAVALLGLLITAALFLGMLQSLFFGALPERWSAFPELDRRETVVLSMLLVLVVVIGIYPRWLLAPIDAAARLLVTG